MDDDVDAAVAAPADWDSPLTGQLALVTGAARGIGAAIAATLARDGARVVCADLPAAGEALARTANRVSGTTLTVDISAPGAPEQIVTHLRDRFGGVDIVVHNAGITRDRLLANLAPDAWASVLDVNLGAQLRINRALFNSDTLHPRGRIVCLSSTTGIAGNRGQTNYGTSKAGVIGFVDAFADEVARRAITINAVAPGFIETKMTAAIPLAIREAGRRMSSLGQGGLPLDVAETIAWYASPGSAGVNGNTVRVCGQSLLGA